MLVRSRPMTDPAFRLAPLHAAAIGIVALAGSAVASDTLSANTSLDLRVPVATPALTDLTQPPAPSIAAAAQPAPAGSLSPKATFALNSARLGGDAEILWPGFLTGLRGFEHFAEPIGNPLYFESPFINSNVRAVYLYHKFPTSSDLRGGDLNVIAAQARLAITDRLALIAPKDGFSYLRAGILPSKNGWNDITVGAKYALIVDRENDFVLTPGFRWEWSNGSEKVLQGGAQEFSPFVSFAKSFDKLNFIGNFTYRIPEGGDKGNQIIQWDLHVDFDLDHLLGTKGISPVFEIHGLHYLTNGNGLPLRVGGMDYNNLGTQFVAGTATVWAGMGARIKFSPNTSLGCTFEVPFTSKDQDILDHRVTIDFVLTW